jgi:hypothetical protein
MRIRDNLPVISRGMGSIRVAAGICTAAALWASPATADSLPPQGFEAFSLGSPNGQSGWSKTGAFDHNVVNNTYGITSFNSKSLRISNAVTSGSFGDQTFSQSLVNEVGETTATNGGMSGGVRQTHFEYQFDIASTVPGAEQPGLSMSNSADRGDGARMTHLRFSDSPTGLQVFFFDYQDTVPYGSVGNEAAGCDGVGDLDNFYETHIGTDLNRAVPHTIRLTLDVIDGPLNDVVRVYIDGALVHTGTSWEDYFRWCEATGVSRTVDSLLFRTSGTAAPATLGNGFLIDNLRTGSSNGAGSAVTVEVGNDTLLPAPAVNGWFYVDEGTGGTGTLVAGPGTPPLGTGSARLTTNPTGTARPDFMTVDFEGTRLDSLTALQYSTYRASADAGNFLSISLQFDFDCDLNDNVTNFQGRMVFEPYNSPGVSGNVPSNTWQTWDTLSPNARWWMSASASNPLRKAGVATTPFNPYPISAPGSMEQIRAFCPNGGFRTKGNPAASLAAGAGVLLMRAGGPINNFDGNGDGVKIGVLFNDKTFNFEACTSTAPCDPNLPGAVCCSSTCAPLPASTVCRAAGGVCDLAETCDGVSGNCPADVKSTAVCRAATLPCDVTETCDGSSVNCPADSVAGAFVVCRAAPGVCDLPENCDGSLKTCPADAFKPASQVCRGSAGVCDPAENCTGSGAACPPDSFLPASTVCRASAGVCDIAETCTGSSGPCPADAFQPASLVCRAAGGVCDAVENCSGSGAACPADAKLTTVCRAAAGQCDIAESCNGVGNACPADALQPDNTVCNNGGVCAPADTCQSGVCVSGGGPDTDGDTVCDASDNCPTIANTNQADLDADNIGDVCDNNDGALNVTQIKMRIAGTGSDASYMRAKGDFVTLQSGDTFSAINGITVEISDGKPVPTVRTRVFPLSECVTTFGGIRVRCKSADRTATARFKSSSLASGVWKFTTKLKRLALASPLVGPAKAVLTYGPATNRVGVVQDCVTSFTGLSCRAQN